MNSFGLFSFLLQLWCLTASAYDWGDAEGRMKNNSSVTLECFYDRDLKINSVLVRPGETCLGDAIGQRYGTVYKVPNRTSWVCSFILGQVDCEPADKYSLGVLIVAELKNGFSLYQRMEWDFFMALMTGSPQCVP